MEDNIEILKMCEYIIKMFFIGVCTYITAIKIINKEKSSIINFGMVLICILIISILVSIAITRVNFFSGVVVLIFLSSWIFHISTERNIGTSILVILVSLSINYAIYFISVIIAFIPQKILQINNRIFYLIIIIILHVIFLRIILKMKKFKNGLSFFQNKLNNEYSEILILNISVSILVSIVLLSKYEIFVNRNVFFAFFIIIAILFITIQKSLQLYYKQKLLVQELDQTKQELADKKKEVEELEAENIKISKNAHTLSHKQKSLEYKIEEMINKTEISKEEAAEVRDRLKEIWKDLYKEKTTIELDKTGIEQIDDMLKYMQSECKKNKIDFELQLKGNIHYMTNNFITKEDLETLLADHIKNAIIAINHTDNINRSILVRLGKIDETYGLYIYDSGIEFEQETLENLGKKPSTTHANEGGTGMGFMNTFDTLRKCKASLIIEEYNKPSKDNYTKALLIKFDNKNEFKIKSYRTL